MCQMKALKNLFLLVFPCLVWVQFASAELNNDRRILDTFDAVAKAANTPLAIAAAVVAISKKNQLTSKPCPYDQICTDDIVLITMDTDLSPLGKKLIKTNVRVAKDPYDLNKGYYQVQEGGPDFRGFYYWVRPGRTYFFTATYYYVDEGAKQTQVSRFSESIYYKSRDDSHSSDSADEGPISPTIAKLMGLPPIPKCKSVRSPGQFCTNQVVHIYWSNDRGLRKSVISVDLYINQQFARHSHEEPYSESHFNEFYYILPDSKYTGIPISFQVKWNVMDQGVIPYHYENSQILISRYTPPWAFACTSYDSWQKCQYHWQNKNRLH